jgi:uncharacterized protein
MNEIPLSASLGKQIVSPPGFHIITKPRGSVCNLDCKYCYFLSKKSLYPGSTFSMDDETLERYIEQYIHSQSTHEINFAWQGGEPTLMGLDFYKQVVELQQKFRKPGNLIQNSLQTNGILLNDEWALFFKEYNFLIGVSLDGPHEYHDAYRLDRGGSTTHARVLKGIEFLKKHKVDFNILCCVHAANADHPLEVYRFIIDEVPAQFIQFIPIVERENENGFQEGTRVSSRSVTGRQYGNFLIKIFDEWARHDIGNIYVQLFDMCLGVWLGQPAGLCVFAETCGLGLALEHNGDLYSCDHFVEPRHFLGNIRKQDILRLVGSEQQVQFGNAKRDTLPHCCQECKVRFICNGGCPKDRIQKTPDGQTGLNYLCEGYKSFFTYIDEPMKIMAALIRTNRPPLELMNILAVQEQNLSYSPSKKSPTKRRRSRRRG